MSHSYTRKLSIATTACILCVVTLLNFTSCSKNGPGDRNLIDSSRMQASYLTKVKSSLEDSLSPVDYANLDFEHTFKSQNVADSSIYFLRIGFMQKSIDTDFILLKTDSSGKVIQGRIIKVKPHKQRDYRFSEINEVFNITTLDRRTCNYLAGAAKVQALAAPPEDPEVVVEGDDDGDLYDWYLYDGLFGNTGGGGGGAATAGGGTGTYGSSSPSGGGGGYSGTTINISTEGTSYSGINIAQYLKCFTLVSNTNATYKMTIYSDIPVNDNPGILFNFATGDCGHTFLQLTKTSGTTSVTQNIGFYPYTGWKSIGANSPVTSKMVDNAGHEFNASLTVSVDATHFQWALNNIQTYSQFKYDIDDFNCTDFALNVFNIAAPQPVSIPQLHIPGGLNGQLSNTPDGLYEELSSLKATGKYPKGQITIPGVYGYVGASHGACN